MRIKYVPLFLLALLIVCVGLFFPYGTSRETGSSTSGSTVQVSSQKVAQTNAKILSKARIDSVTPTRIRLTAGGPPVSVTLKGDNLDHLKEIRVFFRNSQIHEFDISVGQALGRTTRSLSVTAKPSAVPRRLRIKSVSEDDAGVLTVNIVGSEDFSSDGSMGCAEVDVSGNRQVDGENEQMLKRVPQGWGQMKADKTAAIGQCRELRKSAQTWTLLPKIEARLTENLNALTTIENHLAKDPLDKIFIKAALASLNGRVEEFKSILIQFGNEREKFNTVFEKFDQKTNQLFNLLSTVLKNEKDMAQTITRNFL